MVAIARLAWPLLLALGSLHGGAAWDYKKNGADWTGEGLCGSSQMQSPIDLPTTADIVEEDAIYLKYPKLAETVPIYHNGYSIAATLPESFKSGFSISSKGPQAWDVPDLEAYRLWQINFHAPSEHTINGERMPLEMQLMHKRVTGGSAKDSDVAVLVVLFQSTANDYGAFLDSIIKNGLPQKAWDEVQVNAVSTPLELGKLVGGSPYFSYQGSLTVPPCESRVKYFVRQEPVPAAAFQLRQFQKVLWKTCSPKGNYRLTKDITGPLKLMASVDMVNDAGRKVKPKEVEATLKRPGTKKEFQCQSELDNFAHDAHTLMPNDSPKLITAKEEYHFRSKEVQANVNAIAGSKRGLESVQKLYDGAPGTVSKIHMKWDVINAEGVLKGAQSGLAGKTKAHDKAKADLVKVMMDECVKRLETAEAEEAGRALTEKDQAKAAKEAEEQAMVDAVKSDRFQYPEPSLELPVGVDASPFSDGPATPSAAGTSAAKIAPNLQQSEVAAGASISAAQPQTAVEAPGALQDPNVIMSMKLPIPLAKLSPSELIKALAESAHVDPSRLEVKEVHGAKVKKVVTTSDALSFTQSGSRMRGAARSGSSALLVSEEVRPASLK